MTDEFTIIEEIFRPLAEGFPAALGLCDDAALFTAEPGKQLVVTTDTIVANVHFFAEDAPELIGKKLARVNLSDLAAKGAAPYACLLNLTIPPATTTEWLRRFAAGLGEDLRRFAMPLAGGDTVVSPGALTLSLTAFGHVPEGRALLRSGGRPGDGLYVSGTLGDAALGLAFLKKELALADAPHRDFLIRRYHLPEPRLALGQALLGLATAAMDISDGLAGDVRHLCAASGTGAEIETALLPLSPALQALAAAGINTFPYALAGGDDYEILFTIPPAKSDEFFTLFHKLGLQTTRIGTLTEAKEIRFLDAEKRSMPLETRGFQHRVT